MRAKYHYYVCQGHSKALQFAPEERCTARFIPVKPLDELVWKDLYEVLTHPDMIKHALERAHCRHWIPQELQARIERLSKAERQITRQQIAYWMPISRRLLRSKNSSENELNLRKNRKC